MWALSTLDSDGVIAGFFLIFIVPPIAAVVIGWWAVLRQERALVACPKESRLPVARACRLAP